LHVQNVRTAIAPAGGPHLAEVESPEIRRSAGNAERKANKGTQTRRDEIDLR
jgi:hypothetical protein